MTEYIFTGILESYRKDEISIDKAKRQIRLLLDPKDTSDVVNKNDLLHDVSNNEAFSGVAVCRCKNSECLHHKQGICMAAAFSCEDRQTDC